MALPELIEIIPLTKPVTAQITVPGSKSITNRALILAALADAEVTLQGALWSEDTQVMVECLEKLGFEIKVKPDPEEFCNRTISVKGLSGKIPNAGTPDKPLELFVGNAGTAARFLSVFVCLGNGVYRLSGVPRMHERPQAALFQALRELGYRVEAEQTNDKLPVKIFGRSSRGDEAQIKATGVDQSLLTSAATKTRVSIAESSQFASALLLCAKRGNWKVEIVGENAEESPYVAMTTKLIEAFPKNGGRFQIEPDASSGSYFWALRWLFPTNNEQTSGGISRFDLAASFQTNATPKSFFSVRVLKWPYSDFQIDQDFAKYITNPTEFPEQLSRATNLGDSIMTAIVLAPLNKGVGKFVKFTDLGRLRLQECERVVALRTELTKCGAKVIEEGDTLTVYPSPLHSAEIETYNDHRMAMCFAVLGLKVPGIRIRNPSCVKKTFPNFFQKLAAAPPHGLGAEIWGVKDGQRTRRLSGDELFAD
jgi:3-phosphoshikimate 1-carboxyvinyltransferase